TLQLDGNQGPCIGSGTIAVAINSSPTITTQPLGGTLCPGQGITFNVGATGCGSLTYQWYKGGATILGATSSNYTIASIAAGDAASYDVLVSSACGSTPSSAATLAVDSAPVVTLN